MLRKFWRTPHSVKEPLLEEATQEEAEELVEDLHKVWGGFKAVMSFTMVDYARMGPRAQAAGIDLRHFRFDPADHPNLSQDLKEWLSCVKNALALQTQLNSMLLRREHMKMRLASLGSHKRTRTRRTRDLAASIKRV